ILPVATTVYIPDRRDLWTLLHPRPAVLFEAITLLALLGYWRQPFRLPLFGVLFAAGIGFARSYFPQGRGYAYQIIPGVALMGSYALLAFAQQPDGRRRPLVDVALPVLAAGALAVMPMIDDV